MCKCCNLLKVMPMPYTHANLLAPCGLELIEVDKLKPRRIISHYRSESSTYEVLRSLLRTKGHAEVPGTK